MDLACVSTLGHEHRSADPAMIPRSAIACHPVGYNRPSRLSRRDPASRLNAATLAPALERQVIVVPEASTRR